MTFKIIRLIEPLFYFLSPIYYHIHISCLDNELSSHLMLHPPIAKRALYCMCALHPDRKNQILRKMIEV